MTREGAISRISEGAKQVAFLINLNQGVMPSVKMDCRGDRRIIRRFNLEIPGNNDRNVTELGNDFENVLQKEIILCRRKRLIWRTPKKLEPEWSK